MTNDELHASLPGLMFHQQVDVIAETLRLHGDKVDVEELHGPRFVAWCDANIAAISAYFLLRGERGKY